MAKIFNIIADIVGADKEGLTWELTILAHETGTKTYRFVGEDVMI